VLTLIAWSFCVLVAIAPVGESVSAGEFDDAKQIAAQIDSSIETQLAEAGIEAVPTLAGREALRRLSLDLAGRVPSLVELQDIDRQLEAGVDPAELKRATVDRLMESPDFAYHLRNELDLLLMSGVDTDNEFREYLLKAIESNRGWDDMFADMVGVESSEEWAGSRQFLSKRVKDVHRMTNDTSRLFFGVSINCAQCHDHPLVADWLQDHYFGLQSFFSRTYLTKKNTLAEKYSGEVKFKTTAGEDKLAKFMFLTGQVIDEPQVEKTDEQKKQEDAEVQRQIKDDKAPAPEPPAFSPRSQLVKAALNDSENRYLARAIINRTWLRLFGRGLVDPPDQMHSENPASHPELLKWLAEDFVAHQYDLRRTIRGIVLSDTYLRSSVWSGSGELPAPSLFAVGQPRVLTPRQYAAALMVAASSPDRWQKPIEDGKWAE